MFKSLFKRAAKPAAKSAAAKAAAPPNPAQPSVDLKQQALQQAGALENEAAAVDFILHSSVADARQQAIELVHSQAALERLLPAMRNTDRRVARVIQGRLDILAQGRRAEESASIVVAQARLLAAVAQPMANQVAQLDRTWQAIASPPAALAQQYDELRGALGQRLQAQAALQRALLDTLGALRALATDAAREPGSFTAALDALRQQMDAHAAAPEAASLPKHLAAEFTQLHAELSGRAAAIEQRHAALAARGALLDEWESADAATLQAAALRRAWQALPVEDDALQARFDALLQKIVPAPPLQKDAQKQAQKEARKETRSHADPAASKQQLADALERLEHALEEGSLQAAAEQDRLLRAIDPKAARPDDAQSARLGRARAELTRLQGWARWGGNVSRDELLIAAESLPAAGLSLTELAKRVGSLRERWKSLDATAGPSGKDVWIRFDAACSAAYAPVSEHFHHLSEERRQNLQKAQALIDEVRQFSGDDDLKASAAFCSRVTQAWQRLGTIDRKERKRVERDFNDALQRIAAPLAQQRQADVKLREDLIARIAGLAADDRNALDTVRACQEQWQQHARAVPLERRQEQALWLQFRAACDAVFARRKDAGAAVDAERRQNQQQKEALCEALEAAAAAGLADAEIRQTLAESAAAWNRIGAVPRAAEARLDARRAAASNALQARLDSTAEIARQARCQALLDKLRLCQAAEALEAADWQSLPPLSERFERVLKQRFDHAANIDDAQREQHRAALATQLLRLEILGGIDSPAELARERLQLQVEVLQSSLQAGAKPQNAEAQLLVLCGLPARADEGDMARLGRVLAALPAIKP